MMGGVSGADTVVVAAVLLLDIQMGHLRSLQLSDL